MNSKFMHTLAGPKPEDKVGLGAVIGVAQKVVAERYGTDAKTRQDMLNSFVTHGLTQQEAESESVLQLIAGADSTATTIRCTFLYLLTNPSVYAKLVSEIDAAAAKGLVSYPVITDSEAKQLPYLQACLREGLRIWPPLNGIADRIAPQQGYTIDGKFIPGGTRVAFNVYHLMRRRDIWDGDADIFRPERWIEADVETRYSYDKAWELSFGYGRYSCLGKNIALMELNKVFVEVSPEKG
jgi:cytochrome P450